MKNKTFIGIIVLTAILSLTALHCSSGNTSKVTVRINLPDSKQAFNATGRSIFDRFLRFFEGEAAAAAPSNIVSIKLIVSGDGMDPMNLSYTAPFPSSVTLEIPSGNGRFFELLAYTPSVTFRGTATKNLDGGATVDLPITMGLYETKIIIPDYYNNRIVQIDDMSGNGWATRDGSDFSSPSPISSFSPSDIDFDFKGRIYIANSDCCANEVIRINDITSNSYDPIFSCECSINAIAVDRINNFLYFADYYNIYRSDLEGIIDESFNEIAPINLSDIKGLAVENGNLYITATDAISYRPIVVKYSPSTGLEMRRLEIGLYGNAWDVVVKSDSVYVAHTYHNTPTGDYKTIQLSLNLENPANLTFNPNNPIDEFYGPHRFVAILNDKFYIIDEGYKSGDRNRVVSFDDINGTDWTTYGSTGIGVDQFRFFETYYC